MPKKTTRDSGRRVERILALDPSVMNRCGWACVVLTFNEFGAVEKDEWDFGFFEIDGTNFQMRCSDLKDHITHLAFEFDILVVEWPTFYAGTKGQIAAQQGYTINLAGIAMYVAGYFHVDFRKLFLYTAPNWKGTVKKAVTARRFFRMFGMSELKVDHNAIDACMMLVYHCRQQGYVV